jgi:hypothetical protein
LTTCNEINKTIHELMNQIILKMNIRHKNITAVPFLQPITQCTHTSKGPKKEVKNNTNSNVQGVSAKNFERNISVIFQRIFIKFKMQIF